MFPRLAIAKQAVRHMGVALLFIQFLEGIQLAGRGEHASQVQ
jgi:hypothetical protein